MENYCCIILKRKDLAVFIKMKLLRSKSIMEKLNRAYSIVIIPNNSNSIKRISVKAAYAKILTSVTLIMSVLIISIFYFSNNFSNTIEAEELTKESMQQQIQLLSEIVTEQNKSLSASKDRLEELNMSDTAVRNKINEFIKMYTEISDNYVKTSRGNAAKSNSQNLSDLMKISSMVDELNNSLNADTKLMEASKESTLNLEKFIDAIPTLVPANGKISSPFGMRNHPIKKVVKKHTGVDISSYKGDPISAAASGIVEYAGYSAGYGYHVIIDHKNGYKTLYGHSSKLLVKKGDYVKKGTIIALVGSTGLSTGPHLHFEIRIENTPVDPTQYIDFSSK